MTLVNPHKADSTPRVEQRDIDTVARRISPYLHHCIGIPQCRDAQCDICQNAARLGIQTITPMVAREMLGRIDRMFGNRCSLPHPGDD